jgi:hypothetical protein
MLFKINSVTNKPNRNNNLKKKYCWICRRTARESSIGKQESCISAGKFDLDVLLFFN